jgi:hypothetical protein
MTTRELLETLRAHPAKPVIFINRNGDAIRPGYHLTEIKAASYDTVDCGGQTNRWNETIFQLWAPDDADDEYMTAEKFIGIFDRVCSLIDVDLTTEARIEYGDDANFFPSVYSVESIASSAALRVVLAPPAPTCKARDRRREDQPSEAACCS